MGLTTSVIKETWGLVTIPIIPRQPYSSCKRQLKTQEALIQTWVLNPTNHFIQLYCKNNMGQCTRNDLYICTSYQFSQIQSVPRLTKLGQNVMGALMFLTILLGTLQFSKKTTNLELYRSYAQSTMGKKAPQFLMVITTPLGWSSFTFSKKQYFPSNRPRVQKITWGRRLELS